jgi:hypothetical protein
MAGIEDQIAKSLGMNIKEEAETNNNAEAPQAEGAPVENTDKAPEVADATQEQNVPTNTESPSESESQAPVPSFDELLSEKSGGKYKTYTELEQALSTPKQDSPTFANEQLQKLNDYIAQGGDLKNFLETQLKDYSSMSEMELVVEKMMYDDPDLTKDEIELLLQDKFKLNEDDYTESQIKLSKIQLRKESKAAKDFFDKFQKENEIPKAVKDREAESAAQQQQAQQQQKEWETTLDKELTSLNTLDFTLGDNKSFSYKIDDKVKSEIKDSLQYINNFWNRYINEDKSVNYQSLLKDMARIHAGDKLDAFLASQAASRGKEEMSQELDNPTYNPSSKDAKPEQASMRQQVWNELNK